MAPELYEPDTTNLSSTAGGVPLTHFIALAPPDIAEVRAGRQGQLTLDCARSSGRYVQP